MNKVFKVAALGATFIAMATAASAADVSLNIYGASAQNTFWTTEAELFLKNTTVGMGCTSTVQKSTDPKEKLNMTVGLNCANAPANGGTVYIRYTANKSVEGPRAVMNRDPQANDTCSSDPMNDPTRKMADWVNGAFTTDCLDVHVGASDVASESFTQSSSGRQNGNYTTATQNPSYFEDLSTQTIPGLTEIGTARRPIIVPFAFFANTALTVDGLSRQQILLTMSGKLNNWNQFGKTPAGVDFPNKKVVLCMRHAGSGTHATLDKAIMRGDAFLPTLEQLPSNFSTNPTIMFHESSSDMMKCIKENGGKATTGYAAIGYADADANTAGYTATGETKVNATVKRVIYNGLGQEIDATWLGMTDPMSPLKHQIKYGQYEFWSSQWMYFNQATSDANTVSLYTKLMDYADQVKMPCPGKGCYWLTENEMKVKKTNDSSIPTWK
jgi:hypothetical protein